MKVIKTLTYFLITFSYKYYDLIIINILILVIKCYNQHVMDLIGLQIFKHDICYKSIIYTTPVIYLYNFVG